MTHHFVVPRRLSGNPTEPYSQQVEVEQGGGAIGCSGKTAGGKLIPSRAHFSAAVEGLVTILTVLLPISRGLITQQDHTY